MSPKVKTTEGEKIEARFLVRKTSRVKGLARTPKWDYNG